MKMKTNGSLIKIEGLYVYFYTYEGVVKAVEGVNLEIFPGEIVGLVGETGCGKSVTAKATLQLIPDPPGRICGGKVLLRGKNLLDLSGETMRRIRGARISMIFQEPMTSLNPVFKIGEQITDVIMYHQKKSKRQALRDAMNILHLVNMPYPQQVINQYPYELSGGMRQRVMIAMALSCNPDLLIADEPTTALDVTIQAQILQLLKELVEKTGISILLITHDLGVVAQICTRVTVMYAGCEVESGKVNVILSHPQHPYTQGLVLAIPKLSEERPRLSAIQGTVPQLVDPPAGCRFHPRCEEVLPRCRERRPPRLKIAPEHEVYCWRRMSREKTMVFSSRRLFQIAKATQDKEKRGKSIKLEQANRVPPKQAQQGDKEKQVMVELREIKKYFPLAGGLFSSSHQVIKALDGVSFPIYQREIFGLVGESGCGKSTMARLIAHLIDSTEGAIIYRGKILANLDRRSLRELSRQIQMTFQDPQSSLNPRMTVKSIIGEPLMIHRLAPGGQLKEKVQKLMEEVGLKSEHLNRYPHEFSGGQRQRIGLARALILNPNLLILDEPTSALDVSVQAKILNLILDLQEKRGLTYLFISHDLSVIKFVSQRIGVMYLGKIVEIALKKDLFQSPLHPYTQALLKSIPTVDKLVSKEISTIKGEVPSPINPPSGCRFHPRCHLAKVICKQEEPQLKEKTAQHFVACHLV
jgi:peptide/nickel transport system ATP-binding protein